MEAQLYIEYVHSRSHAEELSANLAAALGFHELDLVENREGRMAPAQRNRLAMQEIASPIFYASLSLAGALVVRLIHLSYARNMTFSESLHATIGNLFLLRFSAAVENLASNDATPSLSFTLATFAVLSVAALKLIKLPWRIALDLMKGKVEIVSGRVDVKIEERTIKVERKQREQIPVHFLAVKGRKFEVSKAVVEAMQEGLPYTLYYMPSSNLLVAMEPKVNTATSPQAQDPAPSPPAS